MAVIDPTVTDDPGRLVQRVQDLQAELEDHADPATRALADELVSAVVQMYGAGLERILASITDDPQRSAALAADPLVATLLLIHDLHPVPLQARVQAALDSVRPYMESHGGNVELLSLRDGIARIHLRGSCSDCAASSVTLELAIKQALEEAAPDLEGLEVEGMDTATAGGPGLPMATGTAPQSAPPAPSGMSLPMVISEPAGSRGGGPPAWFEIPAAAGLDRGTLTAVAAGGSELIVADVDGTLLAFIDRCPGCGAALHDGELSDGVLGCAACTASFFLPRAGRSLGDDVGQLTPVPLLRDEGQVRVALAS